MLIATNSQDKPVIAHPAPESSSWAQTTLVLITALQTSLKQSNVLLVQLNLWLKWWSDLKNSDVFCKRPRTQTCPATAFLLGLEFHFSACCDTSDRNCTSCSTGKALKTDGNGGKMCVNECGSKFFNNSGVCTACDSSCATCNGDQISNCLTCDGPLLCNPELKTCTNTSWPRNSLMLAQAVHPTANSAKIPRVHAQRAIHRNFCTITHG